jgi:cyclopropane-fatty-acyl-phospholipid synthase
MHKEFTRLAGLFQKQYNTVSATTGKIPFALREKDGATHNFGGTTPAFTIVLHNGQAVAALSTLDPQLIAEAYLAGHIDLEGDIMQVLAMRELFTDTRGMQFSWRFVRPLLFGQVKSDKKLISHHYDTDADFFQLFLDKRHRAYSQAVYNSDDETLEDAQTRKLDFALEAVKATPGSRILDIGSGWGSFVEHAGKKGIHVTSITISQRSKEFVQKIIDRHNLPCKVLLEHFLNTLPKPRMMPLKTAG